MFYGTVLRKETLPAHLQNSPRPPLKDYSAIGAFAGSGLEIVKIFHSIVPLYLLRISLQSAIQ